MLELSNNTELIQKLAKALDYKLNPIKFINNNILRMESGGKSKFGTYKAQEDLIDNILVHHYIALLKSRQIGASETLKAFCAWLMTFYLGISIGVVSKNGPAATKFARDVRSMLENFAEEEFRPTFVKSTEQSFILENGSNLFADTVSATSPDDCLRSSTLTMLIIDEAAFVKKIDEAFKGMASTHATARGVAIKKELPYGIVVLSTPNGTEGKGKWFYKTWNSSLKGEGLYKPVRIHYSEAPFADQSWYEFQCKALDHDQLKIDQELELKFIVGENSFLEAETAKSIQTNILEHMNCKKEIKTYFGTKGKTGGGTWRYFEEPNNELFYLIGIDISSSYGACNSAIQVLRYPDLYQAAEFVGKLQISDLEKEIIEISKKYENCLVIPEANYGIQMVQNFENNDEINNKLYFTKIKDKDNKVKEYRPGIWTSQKNRPQFIEELYWSITNDTARIRSDILASELLGLDKNLKSNLSDLAIAYAFCAYVAKYDSDDLIAMIPTQKDKNGNSIFDSIFKSETPEDEYVKNLVKRTNLPWSF